ncbi:MAG: ABC transporter ATP-binding protein [Acidimicrobiales bacterium]
MEVHDLVKVYEGSLGKALDKLSLEVESGEFVAITGPSGCGKSTLLHLIAALDTPTSGTIRVNGHDVVHSKDLDGYRRYQVGLVFQLHNLLPRLTAVKNVEIAMMGTHLSAVQRHRHARELLADVDLERREDRRPTELSGGERQRVAIARALANEPSVLLADEPTGNLDSAAVRTVLGLFDRVRRDHGTTILLVTHDPLVAKATDRVVYMQDGRAVSRDPQIDAPTLD